MASKLMVRKFGRKPTAEEFYSMTAKTFLEYKSQGEFNQGLAELSWYRQHRPYYNVYPSIIPMLTRLRLTIDAGLIKAPLPVVNIRFPQDSSNPFGFEWQGRKYGIRTILLCGSDLAKEKMKIAGTDYVFSMTDGLCLWLDIGEEAEVMGVVSSILTYRNFHCRQGHTLEEELSVLPMHPNLVQGVQVPEQIVLDCVRLCCTLCLLEHDPAIVEPDVLADDRNKFIATGDQKYIDKARRRGKFGWNIGRNIEVSPHYRGPCLAALYWTGPGKTVPKIRFRKGCIVHREVVERLPQGFEGDDAEEIMDF